MATTVWYVPGWMRTQEPRPDVMACVSNAFPGAKVEFKACDDDLLSVAERYGVGTAPKILRQIKEVFQCPS